jgi:6-phosphogluconolactonase (cycloisomerase 2 family)
MDGGTIGLDAQGFIYVAGVNDNVYVYGTRGCGSPVRDITGPHTLLNGPMICVDSTGKVYSANFFSNSVTSYAAGSTGDVTPIQDITGRATRLANPGPVAVDANGEVFVLNHNESNSFGTDVLVFAPGATGNVAPVREIKGHATRLLHSTSLAVSSDGWVFVANARFGDGIITVFAPGTNGDIAPTHVINGSSNSFGFPIGVAIQP